MRRVVAIILAAAVVAVSYSCSTTRVLEEDQLRLADNKIVIANGTDYKVSELTPYIKQKPNDYFIGHWNPFIYVYNWSGKSGSKWDRFVEKLGQEPVVYDESLVQQSIKGMITHLEYSGYYFSQIKSTTDVKGKNVSVEYEVSPGRQYPIRKINLQVNDSTLLAILKADSANFTVSPGNPLSQEALETESERLAALLRSKGYYGFSKNHFFYYADTTTTPGVADLFVKIEDYTRNETSSSAKPHQIYTVRNVALIPEGNLKVKSEFLSDLNLIEPNTVYNEQLINTTYERFTSIPLFSSVNMQLAEVDSNHVDCMIRLSPAKLQSVKVGFEGSFNSNGLLGVAPSVSYSHKNIFGGGQTFNLGLGGDYQFRLSDPVHSDEFNVSAGLTFPQFLLLPSRLFRQRVPSTDIKGSFNHQSRPEYTRDIMTLSYGYAWNFNRKSFYQFYPLNASVFRIPSIDREFYEKITDPYLQNSFRNHLDLGGSFNFYYTTDPSVNPKNTYFYVRTQLEFSGYLLSLTDSFNDNCGPDGEHLIWNMPYAQYMRAEVQDVGTLRFGGANRFALAGRLLAGIGYAYGNSLSLPFEKLFYAGGSGSLRGWQARAVGPGSAPRDESFSIANQTGDMHLEANLELRFPIFWKIQGGLFVDAGNVWNLGLDDYNGKSRDPRSLFTFRDMLKTSALDWGLGLRLDIDMLLVRLDMGFKTYNPATQSWLRLKDQFSKGGYALHFGIGYPF